MENEHHKNKEYQTVRLFATLGVLTLIAVLLLVFGISLNLFSKDSDDWEILVSLTVIGSCRR